MLLVEPRGWPDAGGRAFQAAGRREPHVAAATSDADEICHIVERDDPDRALCGKDVTGYPWNPPWPMCVVCVDPYEHGCG